MGEPAFGFDALKSVCAAALRGDRAYPAEEEAGMLALAERHRVVPLLAASLDGKRFPAICRRAMALAQQAARLEQELSTIAAGLSGIGVEFLVLKGPAMARQAYSSPDERASDDLDLWVETRDHDAAVRALHGMGYDRISPLDERTAVCARRAGIETALKHSATRRLVELAHGWRALAPSRNAAREVLRSSVGLNVSGTIVRAPAPMYALLLACIHGAHHRWDRLGWIADVAGLWQRLSDEERRTALATACRWRTKTMLGVGLRLASNCFGMELSEDGDGGDVTGRIDALIRRVGIETIAADSPRAPMESRLRFEFDAQDSAVRRMGMVARWLLLPTMGDLGAVALPVAAYPLYALIRPLRLLRHSRWREWMRT